MAEKCFFEPSGRPRRESVSVKKHNGVMFLANAEQLCCEGDCDRQRKKDRARETIPRQFDQKNMAKGFSPDAMLFFFDITV